MLHLTAKILAAFAGLGLMSTTARAAAPTPEKIDYNRDVRPILSDTCFKCHGFDPASRKGKLRLDRPEDAFADRGGYSAIVPGHPEKSEAFKRLVSHDGDDLMPPEKSGIKLSPRQVEIFKKWIEQGAVYQPHWAFVPPVRPEPPAVKDTKWLRNPIDAFVLSRLEQEKLSPSPQADRATLIRRVTLDLTALPPTPQEVDAFVNDASPDAAAYEKVVNRLLASPHFGERMGQPWLDAARYADTSGYQADWERHMWPWRDWVVKAFNSNKPFDQFTIEQLAGDMLPNATVDQKLASGFNRNHRVNDEGGIIPEEYAVEYVIDRIETTGGTFLGLTVGCARCHDHKYDPITQKEFYSLYAYFNNIPEKGQDGRPGYATPMMRVPPADKVAEVEKLEAQANAIDQKLQAESAKAADRLAAWDKSMRAALAARSAGAWIAPKPLRAAGGVQLLKDGSILGLNIIADEDLYTLTLKPELEKVTAIRVDVLADDSHPGRFLGRGEGNFALTEIDVVAQKGAGKATPVKLKSASADYEQKGYPASAAIDGKPDTAWEVDGDLLPGPRTAIFTLESPLDAKGMTLTVRLKQGLKKQQKQLVIGRVRVSVTGESTPDITQAGLLPEAIAAALTVAPSRRTADQAYEIADYFRNIDPTLRDLRDQAIALRRQARKLAAGGTTVMVMQELPHRRPTYLLKRGRYDMPDTSESLSPGLPSAMFGKASSESQPKNRLELAKWLVSPVNPLTARVTVNRFWQQYFGTGIVKTSEDFGLQGEMPSHPELLDWLATEFIRTGWDTKAMQRLIVTSATYQQSSRVTPALLERDPDNRLLARGPRLRLDATTVRDNALAAAGLLSSKVGGPPVKPYQPPGLWEELAFSNKTSVDSYVQDHGESLYRRTMYTFFKRTVPPPAMAIFDAAGREACTLRLSRTNTPLQALNLLNDVTYVEAARVMAARVMREGGDSPASRISYAFQLATARKPEARELTALTAGYDRYLAKYKADEKGAKAIVSVGEAPKEEKLDVADHAAYTAVCNVILNLDETVTKE